MDERGWADYRLAKESKLTVKAVGTIIVGIIESDMLKGSELGEDDYLTYRVFALVSPKLLKKKISLIRYQC